MFLHVVLGLVVVNFLVFLRVFAKNTSTRARVRRDPSQEVYTRPAFNSEGGHRHMKWTCRVTPKFYDDFLTNEDIRKEVRRIWGMKYLVIHVPIPPPRGKLSNQTVTVQGNQVRCVEDIFLPDMTRCISIDDMSCDEPRKVEIASRIAIAFQPRMSRLNLI